MHKLLQPADKFLSTMAIELAKHQAWFLFYLFFYLSCSNSESEVFSSLNMLLNLMLSQVCVDVFLTTQTYMDIASISVIPKTTGGQVCLIT